MTIVQVRSVYARRGSRTNLRWLRKDHDTQVEQMNANSPIRELNRLDRICLI